VHQKALGGRALFTAQVKTWHWSRTAEWSSWSL